MTNEERYAVIAAELVTSTHPTTDPYSGDDVLAQGELNALNVTRIRANMTGSEIWKVTDHTEFELLTDIQRDEWLAFCAIDDQDPEAGGLAQDFVVGIFGSGATLTALAAAREELISQGMVLGVGNVSLGDVQNARAL